MLSEVDNAIIQYLEEHTEKTPQKHLLSELRARWNEGYLYQRLRTLESRGRLTKGKDSSGDVILSILPAPEAES